MKTLNRFQGRRREDTEIGDLPSDLTPGDYWRVLINGEPWVVTDESSNLTGGYWRIVVPMVGGGKKGFALGNLMAHTVRESDDGTISVLPNDGSSNSILISKGDGRSWHGYIYSGEFREIG